MKVREITIQTVGGPRNVSAEVRGALAIHPIHIDAGRDPDDKRWVVTHVPTGLSVATLYRASRRRALSVLKALEPMADWAALRLSKHKPPRLLGVSKEQEQAVLGALLTLEFPGTTDKAARS